MDGHYFEGRVCPNDGSSSDASHAVQDALAAIGDGPPSIAALLRAGVPADLLGTVLVIEEAFTDWPPAFPVELVQSVEPA